MNSIIMDTYIETRFAIQFDWIIDQICHFNGVVTYPQFFEFEGDFVKQFFNHFTIDNLVKYLNSLQQRILKEANKQKKTKKGKIAINNCWNMFRFIAEHSYFVSKFVIVIEDNIKPLLQFLTT